MRPETIAVHGGYTPDPTTKSVAVPIYQTTSYAFDSAQHGADLFDLKVQGNIYTRIMNPTSDVLEKRIAELEGGIGALALASGSAAVTYALMTIAEQGDNIVSSAALYGGTYNLFAHTFPQMGIEARFADHPGRLDLAHLPSTAADALRLWEWAKQSCLPQFGPFEDAMSVRSRGLFHTRIAPLLNLQRLLPRTVVRDVEALPIPLQSREGFIRQILGWREFVRHVHEATDGCRLGIGPEAIAGQAPLPAAYWGTPSGLRCLDQVVADVWDEGWSHHITRLMVLANLASLLEISPRELTDWFWVAFIDAFDWVVEPNVLGMGTYALGQMMTTKPYISGAAYIDRMSDYCGHCAFDPKSTCPVTPMYWAYLARHREALRDNIRVAMPLRSLDKRAEARRQADARVFTAVSEALRDGRVLTPADVVRASGD